MIHDLYNVQNDILTYKPLFHQFTLSNTYMGKVQYSTILYKDRCRKNEHLSQFSTDKETIIHLGKIDPFSILFLLIS